MYEGYKIEDRYMFKYLLNKTKDFTKRTLIEKRQSFLNVLVMSHSITLIPGLKMLVMAANIWNMAACSSSTLARLLVNCSPVSNAVFVLYSDKLKVLQSFSF